MCLHLYHLWHGIEEVTEVTLLFSLSQWLLASSVAVKTLSLITSSNSLVSFESGDLRAYLSSNAVLHYVAHIESSLEGVHLENFQATILSDFSTIIYYISFFSHDS